MSKETTKLSWKSRIIFAISSGLVFASIIYLFDLFSAEKSQTLNSIIFQGVFFGIFFGLGYPYLNEKLGRKTGEK